MIALALFLILHAVAAVQGILDTVIVGLNREARVVLEADGQIAAETRHFVEVDTRLAHDLFNEDMVEFLRLNRLASFINLVLEDVEGQTIALAEHLIDQELVLLVGVRETNDFLTSFIDMSLIVVTVFDGLLWCHELTNVHSRGFRELLELVRQVLQVVVEILCLCNLLNELLLDRLDLILLLPALSLLHSYRRLLLSILPYVLSDSGQGLLPLLLHVLDLRVVKKPLGEEVDGILWVSLVHNGHAFRDDCA